MAKATVTVGCKLPHGLHLDVGDKRVTVKGLNATEIIGGHGITENVDKEFFDSWLALNREHPAVKNELIFAHERKENAAAQAKSNAKNKSGFEGVDPNKPGDKITPLEKDEK